MLIVKDYKLCRLKSTNIESRKSSNMTGLRKKSEFSQASPYTFESSFMLGHGGPRMHELSRIVEDDYKY